MKRLDRTGLEGLPLKLLIVFLLLSISFPTVLESMQYHDRVVSEELLEREAEKIKHAVYAAYLSGAGNVRSVAIDIASSYTGTRPSIEIGGEPNTTEAMTIRCFVGDVLRRTIYVNEPMITMTSPSKGAEVIVPPGGEVRISCVEELGQLRVIVEVT